jgi:class 3 adenylate cyclase
MRKSVLLLIGMLLLFTVCDYAFMKANKADDEPNTYTGSLDRYCSPECEDWRMIIRWGVLAPVASCYLLFTFAFKEIFFDVQATSTTVMLALVGFSVISHEVVSDRPGYVLIALLVVWQYGFAIIPFALRILLGFVFVVSFYFATQFNDTMPYHLRAWHTMTLFLFWTLFWYPGYVQERANRLRHNHQLAQQVQDQRMRSEHMRCDALLRSLLPLTVVQQLRGGRTLIADKLQCVSIIFTDMKNFTPFSSRVTCKELVDFLNTMFSLFDTVSEQYQIFKIELIGDAYFAVSGCPTPNVSHAACAVEAAMAYLNEMPKLRQSFSHLIDRVSAGGEECVLQIRVGVHSGSVVGGVVGVKGPRYHLFGENVDLAERMESNGIPGEVHISEETHQCLHEPGGEAHKFSFFDRGTSCGIPRYEGRTFVVRKEFADFSDIDDDVLLPASKDEKSPDGKSPLPIKEAGEKGRRDSKTLGELVSELKGKPPKDKSPTEGDVQSTTAKVGGGGVIDGGSSVGAGRALLVANEESSTSGGTESGTEVMRLNSDPDRPRKGRSVASGLSVLRAAKEKNRLKKQQTAERESARAHVSADAADSSGGSGDSSGGSGDSSSVAPAVHRGDASSWSATPPTSPPRPPPAHISSPLPEYKPCCKSCGKTFGESVGGSGDVHLDLEEEISAHALICVHIATPLPSRSTSIAEAAAAEAVPMSAISAGLKSLAKSPPRGGGAGAAAKPSTSSAPSSRPRRQPASAPPPTTPLNAVLGVRGIANPSTTQLRAMLAAALQQERARAALSQKIGLDA